MELYVHIPFCKQKCRYCSFASFPGQEAYFEKYAALILQEARLRRAEAGESVTTVYFGGGTPSLLPPEIWTRLVSGLKTVYEIEPDAEFTSEANPGTVTRAWLDAAVSSGVNRLSFGVQAYQDRLMHLLGRIHLFNEAVSSVGLARETGIENVSVDLIFGIPTQTMADWDETIEASLSLRPMHLSAYGLIPEEGTPLFRDLEQGLLTLPDPDEEREMYGLVIRKADEAGLTQYEISNFARKGFECRHNIGYWTQVPYIGLGVSAASMTGARSGTEGFTCVRTVNPDTLSGYEQFVSCGCVYGTAERISPAESRFETMMLGLRMNRGISETDFVRMHGVSLDSCYGEKLRDMEKRGLLIHDHGIWKMTARGFDIQNSVLVELMDG